MSFRVTPSVDAAFRRVAEVAGVRPTDVYREALYRWSGGQLGKAARRIQMMPLPAALACAKGTWLGFEPRIYAWPYPAGERTLPKERRSVTVCLKVPRRAVEWYEQTTALYGVPKSLLYFTAVVQLASALGVLIAEANVPVLETPETPKTEPESPAFSSADFEVEG